MVDTFLFALMLGSLGCFWKGRRTLGQCLFLVALVGVALLLKHHMTDPLQISL
ncbi:MAG: DUF5993 family protein [Planctomycetota bacterium]|nr:DUF5993 family protein [Planctomycetota bacterium]MDA1105814.1 DUF5993 family protein [Planctomycetota bacterium]